MAGRVTASMARPEHILRHAEVDGLVEIGRFQCRFRVKGHSNGDERYRL